MVVHLLQSIDKGAYYAFSEMLHGTPEFRLPLQTVEWAGALLMAAIACVLLFTQGCARAAALVAAAFFVGAVGVAALQHLLAIPRPENAARMVGATDMLHGFPAGEVFAFTLAGTLLVYAVWRSQLQWFLRLALVIGVIALILGLAMSQIMLVLHFVTDVAAGLFGGLALALLVTRLVAVLQRPIGESR